MVKSVHNDDEFIDSEEERSDVEAEDASIRKVVGMSGCYQNADINFSVFHERI